MGRLPAMRVGVLCDLWSQVRFQPAQSAFRQMERAEGLLDSLDDGATYPDDFVVFRVTGYRPDGVGGSGVGGVDGSGGVSGAALRRELPALIERLSVLASWSPGEGEAGLWLRAEELMERWSVSRSTLNRLRREGLSGRRVRGEGGAGAGRGARTALLLFSAERAEAFALRHGERIGRAGGFVRFGADEELRLVRRAARYRRWFGWSLHRTAERLAERSGRSVEGVRGVLLRHDASSGDGSIFGERRVPARRRDRAAHRAWLRGIDAGELAERWGETVGGVRRGIVRERVRLLRGWAGGLTVPGGGGGLGDVDDEGVLGDAVVCRGLFGPVPVRVVDLIEVGLSMGGPRVERELALSRGRVALDRRVVAGVAGLGGGGGGNVRATDVDALETFLRWSALLRLELMRDQLGLLVRTVSDWAGRPAGELDGALGHAAFRAGLGALALAAGRFDAERGGRFAGIAGLSVQRALAGLKVDGGVVIGEGVGVGVGGGRVLARRVGPVLGDWRVLAAPWCGVLWPSPGVLGVVVGRCCDEGCERRGLLGRWFGVLGDRPVGVVELSRCVGGGGGGAGVGVGVSRVSGLLRAELREAVVAARGA